MTRLRKLVTFLTTPSRVSAEERYLSRSTDLADLENRQQLIARGQVRFL